MKLSYRLVGWTFTCDKWNIQVQDILHDIEPQHEISNNVACVTNKGSDQPAHKGSLIRAFASHLNILSLLSYFPNIIWRF